MLGILIQKLWEKDPMPLTVYRVAVWFPPHSKPASWLLGEGDRGSRPCDLGSHFGINEKSKVKDCP